MKLLQIMVSGFEKLTISNLIKLFVGEVNIVKQHSRLSKTLSEVLGDKSALSYFIQYLELHNGLSYIHCWLDFVQFKDDTQKFIESTEEPKKTRSETPNECRNNSLGNMNCDLHMTDSCNSCDSISDIKDAKSLQSEEICDKYSNYTSHSVTHGTIELPNYNKDHLCNTFLQGLLDDALRIFNMYVSLESTDALKCPEELRTEIAENICDISKILNLSCFNKLEKIVYEILEEYFQGFLRSDYFCKHQIDVLTSGDVVLDDILYNETALFYFMEFLEQEHNSQLLEFWIAASNFQMQLNEQKDFFDPLEAQNDAVVLYDKYFSLQALCPLGFSDKVRFVVEQNICGKHGVMLNCFNLSLRIVEQVLEKNYLKPFVASELFYKYLSELLNSVQNTSSLSSVERSKTTLSDCSSERSFSTNSTFLAMHLPNNNQYTNKGTDMNIDTRQLYDPDSLWKRKRNYRLSFGRVTALGKYEPDFEREPDKSNSSKFKNVVKKFVNIEEDTKKEEMAWQVAEMIIKDITNITLHDQKGYHS